MPELSAWAALVSVHDLVPETLHQVLATLRTLEKAHVEPVTLLVVPGRGWDGAQLRILRALQAAGYPLAGHGWRHEVAAVHGWRHRLHSAFVSRNVAEHLALDADGIGALIDRCFGWFGDHDLDPPALYVPPAWAMGPIPRERLATLPFRLFETLGGLYDAGAGRFRGLPLLGYEADTALRVPALRLWNGINRLAGCLFGPLRIAIHPADLDQRLGARLRADLAHGWRFLAYTALERAGEDGPGVSRAQGSAGRDAAPDRS